ncbi:Peroxidase [Actinidia chinensis var. chinensis]|uniref:Peroxidase n=1 Tax=Actinidia chinensis var. chinensis TaxID=1590841 RepID=A0A2R6PJX0_ACTCC|nr:Peroxidase [Actinidia chinensis var. chinensis]
MSKTQGHRCFLMALVVSVLISLTGETENDINYLSSSSHSKLGIFLDSSATQAFVFGGSQDSMKLQYEFYRENCPKAESIVRSTIGQIIAENKNATAQLLRLMFHDCFIQGCDASVLLDDSNGNSIEKDAIPNQTLKGFDFIDTIKDELEEACPGIVSCADILVLSTRDAIVLAGGPFYPILTGRRDSDRSYFATAMAEIPKPEGNISETLRLFASRGFSKRETVSLLGGHNIGKISCQFIQPRLHNFQGTGQPDPTIPSDFLADMSLICSDNESTSPNGAPSPMGSKFLTESFVGIEYYQGLSSSISSGSVFGPRYYESLLRGRGLLFADQQLMASDETAELVRDYASDDGTTFRADFARAMVKMSNLGALTGSRGQIRLNCSRLVNFN